MPLALHRKFRKSSLSWHQDSIHDLPSSMHHPSISRPSWLRKTHPALPRCTHPNVFRKRDEATISAITIIIIIIIIIIISSAAISVSPSTSSSSCRLSSAYPSSFYIVLLLLLRLLLPPPPSHPPPLTLSSSSSCGRLLPHLYGWSCCGETLLRHCKSKF